MRMKMIVPLDKEKWLLRGFRKFAVFSLAMSFALLVLISAFHHHHDCTVHPECSLCAAACQTADIARSDILSEPVVRSETLQSNHVQLFFSLASYEKTPPRGPPAKRITTSL